MGDSHDWQESWDSSAEAKGHPTVAQLAGLVPLTSEVGEGDDES